MLYDYECDHCGHAMEISHPMAECDKDHKCPECKHLMRRAFNADVRINPPADRGWEYENDGKGRYCPQMETEPTGTPTRQAHFRSRRELIETAQRRGYTVTR